MISEVSRPPLKAKFSIKVNIMLLITWQILFESLLFCNQLIRQLTNLSLFILLVAIDACVNHHLKKRIGGLLTSNTSEILLNKIGKYEPEASEVAKQCNLVIESVNRGSSPTPSNLLGIICFVISVRHSPIFTEHTGLCLI